ncbi:MAG: hypothetical protein GW778_06025 [Alphaproteobacteria bacterium]|nr:hypothetical protein [Alphaproteobacteria bacterium]
MRYLLVLLLIFPFQSARAAQPISISLAECSVIYNVVSMTAQAKGKPETQIKALRKTSDAYKDAAATQAKAEGQSDGKAYIDKQLPALIEKWDERWLSGDDVKVLSHMKENWEWVQYCGKLGKDRGLLPLQ